jgi:hypothetical protein
MKKPIGLLAGLIFACIGHAQITSPDTVCVNAPVQVNTTEQAQTYFWSTQNINLNQPVPDAITLLFGGPGMSVADDAMIVNDNGHYHGFVTTADAMELLHLDFGTNPYGTPTVTNLGNLGGALYSHPEGLDIVKDGGNWYVFIADAARVIRADFGTNLAGTPTVSFWNLSSLSYSMQITIKKYGNDWIGFVGSFTSGHITRLHFGASITNTPTTFDLPTLGIISKPCYFALNEENGNWYMLVTELLANKLVRYNFGSNLMNNAPTAVDLGNPGGFFNLPRGIIVVKDCDETIAIAVNETSNFVKLDFGNSITNPATVTNLGNLNAPDEMQPLSSFWYNDTLNMLSVNFSSASTLVRIPLFGMASGGTVNYAPQTGDTMTFSAAGTQQLQLITNMVSRAGSSAWCKTIVVVDTPVVNISASGNVLTGSGSYPMYQWYLNGVAIAGATAAGHTATQTGTYTVQATNAAGCTGWSQIFQFVKEGIAGPGSNSAVSIYPNPTTGSFTISLNESGDQHVYLNVYNAVGSLVIARNEDTRNNKISLDLTGYAPGMYTIRLQTERNLSVATVLLQ